MLSAESLEVAEEEEVVEEEEVAEEEEVVEEEEEEEQEEQEEVAEESCSTKLADIYTFVARGCFPPTMSPLRRKNLKRYARKFIIDEGKLYYVGPRKQEKREVVIEAARKRRIFLSCHAAAAAAAAAHRGQKKTVRRIQSEYYWLGIIRDVVDWIRECETCRQAERSKALARAARPLKVDAPWELVAIDFLGPFPETQQGNKSAVVAIDYFSKWAEAFAVRQADALAVARCVSRCVFRFGAPKTIACAQTADFCHQVSKALRERWGVVQTVSPLDRLNALHDRTGPLLADAVRRMVAEKQADWDDFLDAVLFLSRTRTSPTTRFSPYALMFNRRANVPHQTSANPPSHDNEASLASDEAAAHLSAMREPQDAVRQLVIANMSAACRQQQKKNSQRRGAPPPPPGPSPPKRDSLYLSFPAEPGAAQHVKTGPAFHLADSHLADSHLH